MKIREALATFQFGKKKVEHEKMYTPWGEALDADNVLREYPRPQMVRSSYINLNGFWEYAMRSGKDRREPVNFDGMILVPFSPEALLSGVGRQLMPDECLWYRRIFENPLPREGGRLILHFGAVDQVAEVYVNGKRACRHIGGYLAFSCDITDLLFDRTNTLTVRVTDLSDSSWLSRGKQKLEPGGMFYTAQSGIWQTVWMEIVPKTYIERLVITPEIGAQALRVKVLANRTTAVRVTAYENESPVTEPWDVLSGSSESSGPTTVKTGMSGEEIILPLTDVRLWTPETPVLSRLTVDLEDKDGTGDHVESYYAMRSFSVGKDVKGIPRLFLNGEPYFQNGVLDQGYWSDGLYTAPSDEALIYDIETMKSAGFNTLRKHLKVEPMRWYYHCDRLGMIVWQDLLNGGGRSLMTFLCYLPTAIPFVQSKFDDHIYPLFSRESELGREFFMQESKELMEQLMSCPCIGLWTAFNEGWGQFDALLVVEKMREWDQTRPIDHASGWYDQGGGDVVSVHNYFRNLKVNPEKGETRPFCLTEYGGLGLRVDGHSASTELFGYTKSETPERFRSDFLKMKTRVEKLVSKGLSAAIYTQVSDVEEEINGLLTYDRRVNKLLADL